MSWQAPSSNGGYSITSYKYRVSESGQVVVGWQTIPNSANTRRYTVRSLTNGVTYTFDLRAVSKVGESYSASIDGTPNGPTTPRFTVPRSFTATAGDAQVVLNWQPPSSNGNSAITHYSYRVRQTTSNTWSPDWTNVTGGASARSQTVTSLTNNTNYTFELRAVNGDGDGPAASVTATPTPPTAPGVPGSFRASPGDTQVTLNWQPPSSDGGSAITHYRYRVSDDGGTTWDPDWTTVTGGGSARSQTVTSLTNNTNYTFELQAVNTVGESSSASVTATPTPDPTAPGAPRSFAATVGNAQVTLNWQPPSSDGGSAITRYRYRVRRTDSPTTWSPDWTTVSGGGSARSRVVTGLTNGVDYTFELKAVNGVGDSSSVSATATPVTTPGTPRSFTATVNGTQVTLGWQAPSSDGGSSITKYRYRVRRTDSPGTWSPDWTDVTGGGSATSQVVTGLTSDVNYTFELRAVNTVGESSSVRTTATPTICAGAVDDTLSGSGTTDDPYIVCSSNHLGLVSFGIPLTTPMITIKWVRTSTSIMWPLHP